MTPQFETASRKRKHLYVFRHPGARVYVRGKGNSKAMTTVSVLMPRYTEMLAACGSPAVVASIAREASRDAKLLRNKSWSESVLAATDAAIATHVVELRAFADENNKAWEALS